MRKFFTNQELNVESVVIEEDYNHIVNVLRKKVGDLIYLFNGDGYDYAYTISNINKRNIEAKYAYKKENNKFNDCKVDLFQAFIKQDNLELISQKLTELGVDSLVLFSSEYTNLKCSEKILDKLSRVSIEACKQCERSRILSVLNVGNFEKMLNELKNYNVVIFAYEKSSKSLKETLEKVKAKNIAVVVGPEGGFSEKEKELLCSLSNVKEVSISKNILRAETASIMLAGIIMYELN